MQFVRHSEKLLCSVFGSYVVARVFLKVAV